MEIKVSQQEYKQFLLVSGSAFGNVWRGDSAVMYAWILDLLRARTNWAF